MARYTRKQIVSDPFVAEFVAFGAGTGNQKVYTLRTSLQNIIGNPDLEDSIRGIFGMEPQEFITVCQARSDLDKQFSPVA
jgi:Na+-translocating ferredoxin:NAD+ oxidoreductase RnfE subunit